MALDGTARVTAVLGPTNTGKTHYAIERMLAHRTGVIGLPLRLLAREVFDRIVALRGPSVVALITGEERIVPPRAAYWVCTVEAMPLGLSPDFLAVDEIQLAADPDRGHIFTNRLLHARGTFETLLLGSDTMRSRIAALVPGVQFVRRERFSQLTYTGPRKLSRMPARSAIVGFSVEDVYAIAELIRRQKGGAAVVMGALSPRTRNAQVALYQNGDVDHLVATDAIGMGLNLDISHVAFSGVVKFDGRRHRRLGPDELAQIAGRAGRYTADGTFGITGDASPLDPETVEAIENHRFEPVRRLQWRNGRLDFAGPEALIASLEAPSGHPDLVRAREADDVATLKSLTQMEEIAAAVRSVPDLKLLWDVCQVPDFRKVSHAEHASLCQRLFRFLHDGGRVPTEWLARQIGRIDRTDGDLDALSKRLAYIRTWTYIAQRNAWLDDADHWRDETRAVEDRLSDALHARLTQRFVDRRTSVLMRRLKQRESLVATVTEDGVVSIDDQFVGRLEGFRFRLDPSADADQSRTLRTAGIAALAPALSLRADKFYNAPDTEIDVTEQGGLMWGEHAVGRLAPGTDVFQPTIQPFVDEDAAPEIGEKVKRRLGHWVDRRVAQHFAPLIALRDDETLSGMARGIAFRLVEAMGVMPRAEIADDVKGLDQESRASLRRHGVRFGQYTIFQPLLLKPAPTRLRLILWSLKEGFDVFPESPPPGLVTVPAVPGAPAGYYPRAGYRLAGERAIRIDMLERLSDMIRPLDAREGFEASPEMLSITGLSLELFAKLMQGMGYQATQGTRSKRRAGTPAPVVTEGTPAQVVAEGAPAQAVAEGSPDVPIEEPAPAPAPDLPELPPSEPAPDLPAEPQPELPGSTPPELPEPGPDLPGPEIPDVPQPGPDIPAPATPQPGPDTATLPEPQAESEPASVVASPDAVGETEVFYLFARAPRRRPERPQHADRGGRDQRPARSVAPRSEARDRRPEGKAGAAAAKVRTEGAPEGRSDNRPENRPERENARGDGPRGKKGGKPDRRTHKDVERPEAPRPPRQERPVDPDNPFAALLALKLRS